MTVDDLPQFLMGLGGLHDVSIVLASYTPIDNRLTIGVADLNWNAEGMPGYRPRPCHLIFSGVSAFSIAAGQDRFHTSIVSEGAVIAEAIAICRDGVTRADFMMSTGEQWYVEFTSLEIEDTPA